jgi:hypothetical protein
MTTVSPGTIAADRGTASRGALWLGLVLALFAPAAYVIQLRMNQLFIPWYLPVAGTLAVAILLFALWRRRSVWRFLAVGLALLLVAAEWLLLVSVKLPVYTGPVAAGRVFPAFTATLADGTPFTQEQLKNDKNTALVFFRGRW